MNIKKSIIFAASGMALLLIAMWLAAGLPTRLIVSELDSNALLALVLRFMRKSDWIATPFFVVLASSATLSAALGLLIALRRGLEQAALDLALALGLVAFFLAMVFLAPLTPLLAPHIAAWPAAFLLDAASLASVFCAAHFYLRFWLGHPRAVTREEVLDFNWRITERQMRNVQGWRKRWYLRNRTEEEWVAHERARAAPLAARSFDLFTTHRGLMIQLTVAMVVALLWRPWVHAWSSDPLLVSFFAIVPIYMLLLMPGIQVAYLIRLHREHGSPEDVRKVEWIRAAYVAIFVMLLLPSCTLPLIVAIGYVGGEPVIMWLIKHAVLEKWLHALLLTFMSTPLIYLLALGASILARGTVDPRLALRRFTLWTLLGLVLTFLFVLTERALALQLVAWLTLPAESGAVLAGAVVAVTFMPIRRFMETWIRRLVERLMPTALLASGERKEVAVALIDITGYTALSAKDESAAVIATTLLQKECRRVAELRNGRVIKSTGDGALLAFETAEEAVHAVREIHDGYAKGSDALNLPNLSLHSGLHWGEVVELHDGDIYGQTVNTTARITDFAKAGEIVLSEALTAMLPQHVAALEPAGAQRFKNMPEPVNCFKLA